ncbi:MAG: hypothetical protein JO013_10755 [Alphaproteobacteria bacterium]|nr:hypothetical protein [Alphaproteobacteria bacterium]
MKLVSSLALAAAVAVGGVAVQPALAAPKKEEAKPAAPTRKWNISPEAKKPLQELEAAVKAKDPAAYATKLAAAQAVLKTNDDKYALAQLMLQHALDTNDVPGQIAALQAAVASGALEPADAAKANRSLGILAANSNNWPLAESALTAATASDANDIDSVINLARAKIELNKPAEALTLLRKGIALNTAAGKPSPESWYQNALKLAYNSHNDAAVAEINGQLLTLFPTQANFKNAVAIYRASGKLPSNAEMDLLRLNLASGTAAKNDYIYLASLADQAGLPAEAKGVIDAGRRAGLLGAADGAQIYNANAPKIAADRASLASDEAKARAGGSGRLALNTGNAYYGYGDYAKAAELFRLALTKPDADASLANLRLGEALAMAGDKAGAAAAFKAVTGPRADVAALWSTWLTMSH